MLEGPFHADCRGSTGSTSGPAGLAARQSGTMSHPPIRFRLIPVVVLAGLLGSEPIFSQLGGAPVEARVPFAPAPFVSDGRTRLAYELHITNFYRNSGTLRLERIEVFAADETTPIARHEGADLAKIVVHPHAIPPPSDPLAIDAGLRAVVYMWVTLPAGARAPAALRHRLLLRTEKDVEHVMDGVTVDVRNTAAPVLGSPFRDGTWLVANGPGNHRAHHWGGLLAHNGRVTVPQRFALDLIGLDAAGKAVRGDIKKSANTDWIGYGTEVLAVADGVVRDMQDGQPDKVPLVAQPANSAYRPGRRWQLRDPGSRRQCLCVLCALSAWQPHGEKGRPGPSRSRTGPTGQLWKLERASSAFARRRLVAPRNIGRIAVRLSVLRSTRRDHHRARARRGFQRPASRPRT